MTEPTNADLLVQLERIRSDIEGAFTLHLAEHRAVDTRFATDERLVALVEERVAVLRSEMPDLRALHDFRVQMETVGSSIRWVLGGSLLAALAGIASLVATFGHIAGG